jgi:mono/diheme cytochrome c family protein
MILIALVLAAASLTAQSQPRPGVGPADRPTVDPAAADRGRRVWLAECITCHGAQARGTEQGANLIRSLILLRDRYGSALGPFLKAGHPTQSGTPSANLTEAEVVDLTHFLRQRLEDTLRGSEKFVPQDILTGDAAAGEAYFNGEGGCTACHSVTQDLAGVAARLGNPVDLQQRMLFPTGRGGGFGPNRAAVTVTLTPALGLTAANERSEVSPRERSRDRGAPASERVGGSAGAEPPGSITGVLVQMDDFYVAYRDDSGALKVVKRSPSLEVVKTDPLQAHHDLLRRISDENIHDLVAYLVTLK